MFGLIGALIGASSTIIVSLLNDRRTTRNDRLRRDAEALVNARVAARILQADTRTARSRVTLALDRGTYWSDSYSLPTASWFTYRERVAQYLPLEAWAEVSEWSRAVAAAEAAAQSARARHPEVRQPRITESGAKSLERAVRRGTRAMEALEAFTQDHAQADGEEAINAENEP
jgi:hypothetical protein